MYGYHQLRAALAVIGADGIYLSGGEQQRIAIARAILKNAPVLILDEATAFADPDNEVRVQQALSTLSRGKTVLMIAHRLSSITGADCIYVMQDGKITESGTHAELLQKKTDCLPICGGTIPKRRNGKSKRRRKYDSEITKTICIIRRGAIDLIKVVWPVSCGIFPLCFRSDFYTSLCLT